jgi:hypothetical protein
MLTMFPGREWLAFQTYDRRVRSGFDQKASIKRAGDALEQARGCALKGRKNSVLGQ